MSVLESTNGINIRRPRREGQHQVIYRECDSDDEDFETVLLLQGLVQAAKQGTKAATAQPSEPLPPLSPLQLELRGICRLGDKEALKTFLANNPEINLDFKDPSGKCNQAKSPSFKYVFPLPSRCTLNSALVLELSAQPQLLS